MAARWHLCGATLAAAIICLGMAGEAVAGRAQACRKTCRDVIAAECGERLGLPRPERICRKDLLRRCKREGVGVCTYPLMVGSWRYDVASCTLTCEIMDDDWEGCRTPSYLSMTFLQRGTHLEETQRTLSGWFTDHASFALEGRNVLGDTATFSGTVVSSSRVTNVVYDVYTTTVDFGACHMHQIGELVR
jgi:hypothetical protein